MGSSPTIKASETVARSTLPPSTGMGLVPALEVDFGKSPLSALPLTAHLPAAPPPTPFTASPNTNAEQDRAAVLAFIGQEVAHLPPDASFLSLTPSTAAMSPTESVVNMTAPHSTRSGSPVQLVGVTSLSTNTTGTRKAPPPPLGLMNRNRGKQPVRDADASDPGSEETLNSKNDSDDTIRDHPTKVNTDASEPSVISQIETSIMLGISLQRSATPGSGCDSVSPDGLKGHNSLLAKLKCLDMGTGNKSSD